MIGIDPATGKPITVSVPSIQAAPVTITDFRESTYGFTAMVDAGNGKTRAYFVPWASVAYVTQELPNGT